MIFIRHKNMRYNLDNVKTYEDGGDEVKFFIKKDIVSPQTAPLIIPKKDPVEILLFEDIARDLETLFQVKRKRYRGPLETAQTAKESKESPAREVGKTPENALKGPLEETGGAPAVEQTTEAPAATGKPDNPFATDPKNKPPAPAQGARSGVSRSPESLKAEKEARAKTNNPRF